MIGRTIADATIYLIYSSDWLSLAWGDAQDYTLTPQLYSRLKAEQE
jgi:hypothetical protein